MKRLQNISLLILASNLFCLCLFIIRKDVSQIKRIEKASMPLHCRVLPIGNFKFSNKSYLLSAEALRGQFNSPESCAVECAIRGKAYLSLIGAWDCECGEAISPGAVQLLATNQISFAKLFFITDDCFQEYNEKILRKSYIGCIYNTGDFAKRFNFTQTRSIGDCLNTCENKQFPIAITNKQESCVCLNTKILFESAVNLQTSCKEAHEHRLAVWRTRAVEAFCSNKRFLTSDRNKLIGLISFPGSGNTWLREMLEKATGIYTGSTYNDSDLYNKGFLGEMLNWKSRKTLVVKDHLHDYSRDNIFEYDKVVLLIRNPYKALVAEFHRRMTQNHTGLATSSLFADPAWSNYVVPMVTHWRDSIVRVLESGKSTAVIYYEDLLQDSVAQIRNIVNFLEYRPQDFEARLLCVRTERAGLFKREAVTSQVFFSAAVINLINDAIRSARASLLRFGGVRWRNLPPYERESPDPDARLPRGVARGEGVAVKKGLINERPEL